MSVLDGRVCHDPQFLNGYCRPCVVPTFVLQQLYVNIHMEIFKSMGVPPNHPQKRIVHKKTSISGVFPLMKSPSPDLFQYTYLRPWLTRGCTHVFGTSWCLSGDGLTRMTILCFMVSIHEFPESWSRNRGNIRRQRVTSLPCHMFVVNIAALRLCGLADLTSPKFEIHHLGNLYWLVVWLPFLAFSH